MKVTICDLCGKEIFYNQKYNTTLNFGYKVHGWYDFKDLCPKCGMWLYTFLNGEKRIRLKSKDGS